MLSPHIRDNEPFNMTLEIGGVKYSFQGVLTDTEINSDRDAHFISDESGYANYLSGRQNITVNLQINVPSGQMTRSTVEEVVERVLRDRARGNRRHRNEIW